MTYNKQSYYSIVSIRDKEHYLAEVLIDTNNALNKVLELLEKHVRTDKIPDKQPSEPSSSGRGVSKPKTLEKGTRKPKKVAKRAKR